MKITKIFSIIILITSISISLFGQDMSPEQLEVWNLEELRVKYIKSRDVDNFRAMYHENFIGWPSQATSPVGHSDLGYRIIEAIEEGRDLPRVRIRREAVRIFENIAIVHYASSRSFGSDSDDDPSNGKWIKVTHTWMRVGDTWKIIGGMAASLPKENK